MSWKCNLLGHSFSQWLEDKEQERQERWCKRCQFLEISRLVLEPEFNCEKGSHNYDKWLKHPSFGHTMQARYCKICGKMATRNTVRY